MSNKIKIKNPFIEIERREEIKKQRISRQQTDDSATPRTFAFYRGADPRFEMYADKFTENVGNK